MKINCTLEECPPGLFLFGDCLGFKTEYQNAGGGTQAYVVESGEAFGGGAKTAEEREKLMVYPVSLCDPRAIQFKGYEEES